MRVKRGTLPSTREGGRLYVLLNTEPTPEPERPHDRTHERERDELIAQLRSEVEAWREEARRKDHLLAAALERIPAIEAPQESPPDEREPPLTASEKPQRGDAPGDRRQTLTRPWWRRFWR
jgi:hypothetical protein